jgi:hypothetical protein
MQHMYNAGKIVDGEVLRARPDGDGRQTRTAPCMQRRVPLLPQSLPLPHQSLHLPRLTSHH